MHASPARPDGWMDGWMDRVVVEALVAVTAPVLGLGPSRPLI